MILIPKYSDFYFKLLVLILWGEGELKYIRRQKNRYLVHTGALRKRFKKKTRDIHYAFDRLSEMGYIHSVIKESGSVRFYMTYPGYLQLSENSADMESYVPERKI